MNSRFTPQRKNAFSLVELSIVLVILGLLTGGILAGRSLIRASELRAVSTDYSRYVTATHAFRDKYFALPGDMSNATAVWGRMTAGLGCLTGSSASVIASGACDGSADGQIDLATGAGRTGELFQFWRQLAAAGLIEGSFTGLNGADAASTDHEIGENCPASKLNSAGWGTRSLGNYAGSSGTPASSYNTSYGNVFTIGAEDDSTLGTPVLRPEEVWNIDTKLDDGKPGRGKVLVRGWKECTNSADVNALDGDYLLTATGVLCTIWFRNAY